MKFLLAVLLTIVLAFISGLYLPWWGIAIAAFIAGALIPQRGGAAFLSGFTGLFLLWGAMALWIDQKNQSILSHKIAALLPLNGNVVLLILVTAFVGALVAGFASMSGSFLRAR